MHDIRKRMAGGLLAIAILHTLPSAIANDLASSKVRLDIPSQPLSDALLSAGEATKRQILFPGEEMDGLKAPALHGEFTTEEAVRALLAGTQFIVEITSEAILIKGRSTAAADPLMHVPSAQKIVVTGSRIRGATGTSPVFKYDAETMRDQGINNMTSLAAAIPQNFSGGQNPAVGGGAESRGSVLGNSSTSLNLRGLGPDATLTLLNGHRLAYNQNVQAVDISAIPFAAVDRLEIMPDGASAIYGSDAVGGVANIILKKDYDGAWINAVIGGATDGGYLTQNFSTVGGKRWQGGGVIFTASYDRSTDIKAPRRSFTSDLNPDLLLYPSLRSYSFLASAHHDLTNSLTASVDAMYSGRKAIRSGPYTDDLPYMISGSRITSTTQSFNLAPTMTLNLLPWMISVSGVYGINKVRTDSQIFPAGFIQASFDNETSAAEFAAEGPLLSMPAGEARLALGGGHRVDKLISRLPFGTVDRKQSNDFAYGELNIPLAEGGMDIPAIYRASINAAVRYENYPGIGDVFAPKVGGLWSPSKDFDLTASWGRSFKAPSLLQRYAQNIVLLYPGDLWGAREAPAEQRIIYLDGGNAQLKPERARTVSATVNFHPDAVPGLRLSMSYFDIRYRNRIVQPIISTVRALIDPAYANSIILQPSLEQINDTVALSDYGIEDITGSGQPFDPLKVYAIIDNRFQNVSQDKIHGIDAAASYSFDAGTAGHFSIQGNGTYLASSRILIEGLPSTKIAGTIFYPAHFKIRAGISWDQDETLINVFANYVGGVRDNRSAAEVDVGAVTTIDFSIKRHFGGRSGFDLQASALNLFNHKPDRIRSAGYNQSYNFTNYSPIGRYLSVSVTKAW